MRRSELLLLAALTLCAGAAAAAPGRVVSMNLCTDDLAMMVAGGRQLLSVSRIAADPLSSPLYAEARGYRLNGGGAEEIYAMAPDLVLAGDYSDPLALGMLKGLGVKVERFAVPRTLEEVPGPVSQMGRALGREAAAAAIVAAYRARLAALPAPPGGARPIAAFFHPGGYTLGAGTMADAILARAGFDNLADRLGRSGGGYLSLEELVMHRPDVIVTSPSYAGASRAEAVMTHPALAGIPRVVAGPEWTCGTPYVLDAVAAMIAAREALK